MKFFSSLTSQGKIVFGVAIFAIIGCVLYFGGSALQKNGVLKDLAKGTVSGKLNINEDADIVLAYNTFVGAAGIVYMNGGMEPNEESRLFKEYGIKLQIKQVDVVSDTRDALKTGAIDLAYCTVDALSTEMGSGSSLLELNTKLIAKINESRGADALVVTPAIKDIKDLKGKKIAYAVGTASNTLLINILETAGMTLDDIEAYKVADGIEAAKAFTTGTVDGALVWAPDDEDCVKAVKGAKIFISTATASSIIADGVLVTAQNLEAKKENIQKLIQAWMVGNGELNDNPTKRQEAAKLFAKSFGLDEGVALAGADKVRYSTYGDNKQFFGLDATFTGVTGEKMYSRMAVKYTQAGLAKGPVSWNKFADESIIEAIGADSKFATATEQSTEKPKVFAPVTKAEETATSTAGKNVSITFPSAGYTLDDYAKSLIDREVTGVAQGLSNAKIRIVGNTDNIGDKQSNVVLSYKRAEAVAKYLVSEHGFDRNKFVVVGKGDKEPVCTEATDECRAKNRRTDFQFLW